MVGVIQLINKREGQFNDEDVAIMNSFLIIAGPVLAQSQLFQRSTNEADSDSNEFTGKQIVRAKSAQRWAVLLSSRRMMVMRKVTKTNNAQPNVNVPFFSRVLKEVML